MSAQVELVHESTLLGAVDSYLKELVHVRPFLVQRYSHFLQAMAERWLAELGVNDLRALDAEWLHRYLTECTDRPSSEQIVHAFLRWAMQRHLIERNSPLFNSRALLLSS